MSSDFVPVLWFLGPDKWDDSGPNALLLQKIIRVELGRGGDDDMPNKGASDG